MDGELAVGIEGVEQAVSELQSFVDESLMGAEDSAPYLAGDDFDIVFAETVQAQALARGVELAIRAHLGIAMSGGPFPDVGVKALAILYHRSQQSEFAPLAKFGSQAPAKLVAGLGYDGDLAIGAVLCSQAREEQTDEVIDLGDGRDGAFATAATGALLDADGRRYAGDSIDVRPRELLDELPGIDVHRIEESTLALGEEQIERKCTLARAADTRDHDEPSAGDAEREILEVMLPRAMDDDGLIGFGE